MNIVVVGIGNIGTAYGWALARAGHRVTHLVRPSDRPRPAAARLDVLDERPKQALRRETSYHWTLDTAVPGDTELVLIATPATAVRPAVETIAPRAPEATVLTWALEWNPVDLADLIEPERLLIGYPDSGGTRDENAKYVLSLGAEPHLGRRRGNDASDRLQSVLEVLTAAGFRPSTEDPFEPWLWVHCASTIPYWVALDQPRDLRAFAHDRGLLRQAFLASREVLAVVAARGADLAKYDEAATAKTPAWLFPWAFRLLYATNEGMRRAAAHGVAGIGEGITLADQVLATAEELHIDTPILRRLRSRVQRLASELHLDLS